MKHIRLSIAILILLPVSVAVAQDEHTVPVPAFELPYTTALRPPMPVSGLQMPLTFSSETPRSNFVMGSIQVGAGYDDNIKASPSNHISDVSYLILPIIDIAQTRERWNWDFGYSPGFTINQKVSETSQSVHNLHMLFDYRLSPHVTAQVWEGFEKTNSLYSGKLGEPSAGPGPLQQPNTSGITPFANVTGNTTGLNLTYQLSASSLVGANGNYYFVNYDAPAGSSTSNLIDTSSWGGNAFFAHLFSNRHWAGFTYNFQRFLFDPGNRTDVSRTLLFYSVSAGSHGTFSLWVGPEQTNSVIPSVLLPPMGNTSSRVNWGVAGGAELTWQGRRTSTRVAYTRQTSDGGGLAQAVRLEQVDGEIRQHLTARWMASAGVAYARNNPLITANGSTQYRSLMGNAGFEYHLTDHFTFGFRYGRDQLQYASSATPSTLSNRNRVWFSAAYSFSRSLGR